MKVEYTLKDDTLTPLLERLKTEVPKASRKAVEEAATNAEKIVEQVTPRSGISYERRQQVNPQRRNYYLKPLADTVVKSRVEGVIDNNPSQKIGYGAEGWRRHFPAYGTIYQPAQGFIEVARDKVSNDSERVFRKHIRRAIGDD